MAANFLTDREVALVQATIDKVRNDKETLPPSSTDFAAGPQNVIREFQLTEELGPNTTAEANLVLYQGDGATCTTADFVADTSVTFRVGGGAMTAFLLRTFAAGTRGQCWKSPKRKWWTIVQIDCEPATV